MPCDSASGGQHIAGPKLHHSILEALLSNASCGHVAIVDLFGYDGHMAQAALEKQSQSGGDVTYNLLTICRDLPSASYTSSRIEDMIRTFAKKNMIQVPSFPDMVAARPPDHPSKFSLPMPSCQNSFISPNAILPMISGPFFFQNSLNSLANPRGHCCQEAAAHQDGPKDNSPAKGHHLLERPQGRGHHDVQPREVDGRRGLQGQVRTPGLGFAELHDVQ